MEWLFWDCNPNTLDPIEHSGFMIGRILGDGDWSAIVWLRRNVGDRVIRDWLIAKQGGGLDPRRLRFWELILDLPGNQVDEWVTKARLSNWHNRMSA